MERFRAGKRLWESEDDALLLARFPHEATSKLARDLRRSVAAVYNRAYNTFALSKTSAYLASAEACRLRRGDNVGAGTRFPKGHVPVNKGLRRPGWGPGRMKETQFKPGVRQGVAARNWRPIGTILVDPDGYLRIKVREARRGEPYGFGNSRVWPQLHRQVWERAHGPVPPGHRVAFKNGDRSDVRLDNLELLTRRELMARNTIHTLPKPLAKTIQLLGALERQIRRRTSHEEQDRRPA